MCQSEAGVLFASLSLYRKERREAMKEVTRAIRTAMAGADIFNIMQLAERIGLPPTTLYYRFNNPETFRLSELQEIARVTSMSDALLLSLIRGGGR